MGPDPSIKAKPKDSREQSDKKTPAGKDVKTQEVSDKSVRSADRPEMSLKRTHETMAASNASNKKIEVRKVERKKVMPPQEIRNILIAKLPQLKDNIMMLDDIEIERIFY